MPYYRLKHGAPLWFPPLSEADEDGLLMIGADLSPQRLLYAYSLGIFPWYSEEYPILWFSPDPRCVLFPEEIHFGSRLLRYLKHSEFSITVDTVFEKVIHSCASVPRPNQDGTWIVQDMIESYTELYKLGYAHSVEVWKQGILVGGLYGILLGKVFFGESMFHIISNASKAALFFLVDWLIQKDVRIIDCQQATAHIIRFGAREIPREDFTRYLEEYI